MKFILYAIFLIMLAEQGGLEYLWWHTWIYMAIAGYGLFWDVIVKDKGQ